MSEKRIQVNAEINLDLVEKLDEMCLEDENNRSQFIRKLIRREWEYRRNMYLSTTKERSIDNKQQTTGSK